MRKNCLFILEATLIVALWHGEIRHSYVIEGLWFRGLTCDFWAEFDEYFFGHAVSRSGVSIAQNTAPAGSLSPLWPRAISEYY